MLSQVKKLRHKILKWLLHRKSGTTLSNLKRIIPELTKVIKTIPSEGKSEREILHTALKKMGWTTKDIKKLSQKTERHKAQNRNISPSFAIQDKKNAAKSLPGGASYRSVQGGSPGLGKNK